MSYLFLFLKLHRAPLYKFQYTIHFPGDIWEVTFCCRIKQGGLSNFIKPCRVCVYTFLWEESEWFCYCVNIKFSWEESAWFYYCVTLFLPSAIYFRLLRKIMNMKIIWKYMKPCCSLCWFDHYVWYWTWSLIRNAPSWCCSWKKATAFLNCW